MADVRSELWNTLPCVIIVEIFSFLSLKNRLNASSVCKSWRECLFHPSLWHKAIFRVNSCDNRTTQYGDEGARFLANKCGRFVQNAIIEVNSLNPRDVMHSKEILDVLAHNSNLRALTLRPRSCRLEWLYSNEEELILDQYLFALHNIILKANKLEHLSFGCVQEILDQADSFLLLLAQHHSRCLKSLHLSSVKEYPDNYDFIDIQPVMFDPFCYLESLSIDYDNISDELLLVLSKPHKKALRYLNIHIHSIADHNEGTSNDAWGKVIEHSPNLRVTVTLLHSYGLTYSKANKIFNPNMPLAHFRSYFSCSLNARFLDFIAAVNKDTLESLTIVESLHEDMPTATFLTSNEDPLVMLAWRCKKLSHLTVIGYEVCSSDIIAIARLRGPDLKELNVPSCCILINNSDEEYRFLDGLNEELRKCVANEVSCSLGRPWVPLSLDDLPASICNVNMDADGIYLEQLLNDQNW